MSDDFFRSGREEVLNLLRTDGIPAVAQTLSRLSDEAEEGWQKSLLKLGVALVSEHGAEGLSLLETMVDRLQKGEDVDLSKLSMEEASDLLAIMQKREAETKNRVALYTTIILEEIGKALALLISILFKEIKL